MGREIVYCDSCGDRIVAADFDKGRARTFQNKNYCHKCVNTISLPVADGPSPSRTADSKRLPRDRPPPATARTTRDSARESAKLETRRIRPGKPARNETRLTLIIGAVVVVIVLLIVAILAASRG
jgi:hypothetical protein